MAFCSALNRAARSSARIRLRLVPQLRKHRDHLVLARRVNPARCVGVFLHVLAVGLEALESTAGGRQGGRVMLAEVGQHLVQGAPQAVDIEAVEAGFALGRPAVVAEAQPFGQLDDFLVGPHPGWPAVEGVQHFVGAGAGVGRVLDVAVDAVAIGPIALDGDEREAFLLDQPAAQRGTPDVILVRTVRCLAEKDTAGFTDAVQQRVEIGRRAQRPGARGSRPTARGMRAVRCDRDGVGGASPWCAPALLERALGWPLHNFPANDVPAHAARRSIGAGMRTMCGSRRVRRRCNRAARLSGGTGQYSDPRSSSSKPSQSA